MKNKDFIILISFVILLLFGVIKMQAIINKNIAYKKAQIIDEELEIRGVPPNIATYIGYVKAGILKKDDRYYMEIEAIRNANSGYDFLTKEEIDTILQTNI